MGSDSADWVVLGATDRPGWPEWTFRSSHLAGYRPLAAISYSLNYVISGFEPVSYRLLDVALHVGVAYLIFALYRRFVPALPQWGGWLASGLFLAHPLAEQIVPIMARRSYSLAALFSLSALILIRDGIARSDGRVDLRRLTLGTLLLACGLLSNETAFVTVAVILALPLYVRGLRFDRVFWTYAGVPLVAATLVIALRWVIIGGLGGYAAGAAFRGMNRTASVYSEIYGGSWWIGWGLCLYVSWRLVSAYRRGEPLASPAVLFLFWLAVSPVPSLISGTWFLRQLYPALIPFCLLIGVLAATAGKPDWASGFRLAIPLLVVAGLVFHSPSLRGPGARRMQTWQERRKVLVDLHQALMPIQGPARVLLVLPYPRRQGPVPGPLPWIRRLPAVWTTAQLRDRDVSVVPFLFYERSPNDAGPKPVVGSIEGRPTLTVPAGLPFQLGDPGSVAVQDSVRTLRLDEIGSHLQGSLYVYAPGELTLVR